jgi:hypothetical protein
MDPIFEPLLQQGVMGGVLVWFMLRFEKRQEAVEKAIDRFAKSVLLLIVDSSPNMQVKDQASEILKDIK